MVDSHGTWLRKLIRDELVKKSFWALAALGLGIAAVLQRRDALSFSALELSLMGLLASLVVALLVWAVYRRVSYRVATYPRMRPHYEILEKEITYKIDADGLLHFSRKIKLKALIDNVDSYIDRYVWTGGDARLPEPGPGAASITELLEAGIWRFYSTRLPHPLRKGKEHELQIHWPPLADWRTSKPFVSTSTEEPTRRLTFKVEIPLQHLREDDFLAEEMRGIESIYPFKTTGLAREDRLVWTFKPKLYRHYRIRWAWADGEAVRSMPAPEDEESHGG